jgi:hypothetical protein
MWIEDLQIVTNKFQLSGMLFGVDLPVRQVTILNLIRIYTHCLLVSSCALRTLRLFIFGRTGMILQHIWTHEPPSTAVADSLDHPPMHLIYMTSKVILLDTS